jgi:hypothetical protein
LPRITWSADRWRGWLRHAFAVAPAEPPVEAERVLARRLAGFLVRRGLAAPALMLLESGRPLSFIGSQVLAFLGPFATLLFPPAEYGRLVALMEKREGVDLLVAAIEEEGCVRHE